MSLFGTLADLLNADGAFIGAVTGRAWAFSVPSKYNGAAVSKPYARINDAGGLLEQTTDTLAWNQRSVQVSVFANDPDDADRFARLATDVLDKAAGVVIDDRATLKCLVRDDEPRLLEDPEQDGVWQAMVSYTAMVTTSVPLPIQT